MNSIFYKVGERWMRMPAEALTFDKVIQEHNQPFDLPSAFYLSLSFPNIFYGPLTSRSFHPGVYPGAYDAFYGPT